MGKDKYVFTFLGDVMLGRIIGKKFSQKEYGLVDKNLIDQINDSDYVIANLESPIPTTAKTDGDHLSFSGNVDTLNRLNWINLFSLSNNHINDCGSNGISETICNLEKFGFNYTGVYENDYQPYLIEDKFAIITLTDMLNIPFSDDCKWKTLRVGDEALHKIKEYHEKGKIVILYAHIGMLFTRFPNPKTYEYLHKCIDYGADLVVTVHSHCAGGMEYYKGKPIFHSLGDFVMDGNSFRRRRSVILRITFNKNKFTEWKIIPAEIDMTYTTIQPLQNINDKIIKSFNWVTTEIAKHNSNYKSFYKWQYKKEMLNHTYSTLSFLYKQRGFCGLIKMLLQRFEEVNRMLLWFIKDRSNAQRDDDAIKKDRKKFNQDELFD